MKGKEGYKLRTITCVSCGKTITGHLKPDQRYCSLECYRQSPRPQRMNGTTVSCAVCQSPVYIPQNRQGKVAYFCSTAHMHEWQGRNKTNHICKICGDAFRWSPSRHVNNNITYCSLACRDADPDRHAMLINMNVVQQQGTTNSNERAGYAILDTLGIDYERQYLIGGKFCVDAFIPGANLVVQFDGDYWHGNPAQFPDPDQRQRKRMRLDASQDAYMAACGYTVARFWASEIEKTPEHVRAELLRLITH